METSLRITVAKMKYVQTLLGVLIILALSVPASAQFYRYVDQHGNVMYTDDLSKVPEDQRSKVQHYEESRSPEPVVQKADSAEKVNSAAVDDVFANERRGLQDQEKALNQEYEDLMQMRNRLNEEKSKAVTNAQIKSYNDQIIEFNERIKSYEHKRDALAADVRAFNQKIEAHSNQAQTQ